MQDQDIIPYPGNSHRRQHVSEEFFCTSFSNNTIDNIITYHCGVGIYISSSSRSFSDEGNVGGFSNSKAQRECFAERYGFSAANATVRDEETGYGYFGARYMDHELMTMWLSVDPMADKYPGISPYAYCTWNPVKLIDPDGREVDDWYNLKGELIKHTDSGTKKYLVLTEGTDVDESKTIPVPQQETLNKMSAVYIDNEKSANASRVQNEKGMAVKSDGLPTQVVTGHPDYITKEQWNPAMIEVGDMSNLDFLIHLHPINLQDMKVGDPDPSDVDRDVHNFFNSKVNVIQYFNPTLDFNRSGLPTKIGDYVPSVSFYNQTSPKSIHTMSFRSFHSLVKK